MTGHKLEACAPDDRECEQRNDNVRFAIAVHNAAWLAVLAIVIVGVMSIFW